MIVPGKAAIAPRPRVFGTILLAPKERLDVSIDQVSLQTRCVEIAGQVHFAATVTAMHEIIFHIAALCRPSILGMRTVFKLMNQSSLKRWRKTCFLVECHTLL